MVTVNTLVDMIAKFIAVVILIPGTKNMFKPMEYLNLIKYIRSMYPVSAMVTAKLSNCPTCIGFTQWKEISNPYLGYSLHVRLQALSNVVDSDLPSETAMGNGMSDT